MSDGITRAGTVDDAVAEGSPICDWPVVFVGLPGCIEPPLELTPAV